MSARPTTKPMWDTDGQNIVVPMSMGEPFRGWTLGQKPASSTFNWWMHLVWRWIEHFADSAWEGDHSIDGALHATGPTVFDDAVNVGLDLEVTGDAAIGDDLTVGGDVIATGDLRYSQQRSRHLNAAAARAGAGITWDDALSRWNLFTSTNLVTFPIDLAVGDRIHSWMVFAQKTSVTGTLSAYLARQNLSTGLFTAIGATQTNSAVNPGHITLGQLVTEDAPGDCAYVVVVQGGGSAGDYVKGVEINTTRP